MMRSFRKSSVISVSSEQFASEKSREVLQIVKRKGPPLTAKQVEFCNEDCIVRYLKAKGNHVKRAAKQLRTTLTWRAMLDVDYLTADEFSAELASGIAYVAGQDQDDRPVVIVRLKPDNIFSTQAQNQFLRYFAFTMEVAIASMSSSVQQCVLIFDASRMKRGSSPSPPGLSVVYQLLKVLGEHYPERLSRAFVVDASSMFHLLWKGVGKFLDQKMREKLKFVYSRSFYGGAVQASCEAAMAKFPSVTSGACTGNSGVGRLDSISRRILWEEEADGHEEDEGGPAEGEGDEAAKKLVEGGLGMELSSSLSMTTPSSRAVAYINNNSITPASSGLKPVGTAAADASLLYDNKDKARSMSFAGIETVVTPPTHQEPSATAADASLVSDKARARSLSFAAITAPRACRRQGSMEFRSFRADFDTSAAKKAFSTERRKILAEGSSSSSNNSSRRWLSLSFRFSREDSRTSVETNRSSHGHVHGHGHWARKPRPQEAFAPYYDAFLRKPYSEAVYRSSMKPPLAGLISILSSELKLRQSLGSGAAAGAAACGVEALLIDHLHLAG